MMTPNCDMMYTGTETGPLIDDLVKENSFLLKLVDTIPPSMYFDNDIQDKITSEKHSTMDERAEGLKRSFRGLPELSTKNKHKRARLDPLFQKSVSQIHQEMNLSKQRNHHQKKDSLLPSASLSRAANIEELQKRLQERIDEFQSKRKGISYKDPRKKKLKYKEKKMKQKKVALSAIKETEMQTKSLIEKKKKSGSLPKPTYNKEGKIIYSKLDFSEDGFGEKKKSEFSGKKVKDLLKKAEKKKEKIESLKNTNPEKAIIVEEKEKWNKAILKSENVKVKDDPELLKKSIKRQEKIKQKKAKAWKERVEHTEGRKQKRQAKRTKNIQKQKKVKLEHKIKHAKKKGRLIPGF